MINNKPIGIFDSGLGGLTVLKILSKELPKESFIFFGDTAHVPYGNKSKENIKIFSNAIIKFLLKHSVKMIVVACNTVSAVALSDIQKTSNIPIIGVISPLKSYLKFQPQHKKIGIIGTENTINSKAYSKVIHNYNSKIEIYSLACPLFVPIIEEGLENHRIAYIIAEEYLQPFLNKKLDLLILGCTHYPIIKKTIKSILSNKTIIIDSATITVSEVKKYINNNNLHSEHQKQKTQVYVSDKPKQFKKNSAKFLGNQILDVQKVDI